MGTRRLSWAEQFEENGWNKGVKTGWDKGIEKGVEKGVEAGVRQTLLRLLGARFGPLTDDVRRRVEAIHSVERLNQIAEHLLVARSLEEMDLR
jgi:flagellar biosynthesis/type III secretory pathway protein FliH